MNKLVILFGLLFMFSANADVYVSWSAGDDIEVKVPALAGMDKKVIFPEPVSLGVTPSFKSIYRVQIVENAVYFTAKHSTDARFRVLAKGVKSKKTYILNVKNSADEADKEAVVIREEAVGRSRALANPFASQSSITPAKLARYASQMLYAPEYAIETVEGVKRVALNLPENMDVVYEGGELEVKPTAAWQGGGYTITAFEVRNYSTIQPVNLDMANVYRRVDGVGAFSQHTWLGTDKENNTTALFIITEGALASSLRVRML